MVLSDNMQSDQFWRSDKQINSPNSFNTLSRRRDENLENYQLGIILLCNTKFSGTANKGLYGHRLGELYFRSYE